LSLVVKLLALRLLRGELWNSFDVLNEISQLNWGVYY